MEILAILAFVGVLFGVFESIKPDPPKTAEKELGEAIAKYLEKGIKAQKDT